MLTPRRYLLVAVMAYGLVVPACSSDSDPEDQGALAVDITQQGVAGNVKLSSGSALSGVNVAVGAATATTDAKGDFFLKVTAGEHVLQFTKAGHVPVQKKATVLQGASRLELTMMAEAAAKPLDSATGGTIAGDRGAKVVAPAAAFVNKAGAAVTGQVDVHLTPLDPSKAAELDAYPGDLSATTAGGESVQLETFGVLDVTVRQNGEKVQVKSGEKLTVSIPVGTGITNPPATMALWSFDEAKAIWVEEGTATYDSASNTYIGEIAHMSPWNVDKPLEATCLRGKVVDDKGAVVAGGLVKSSGVDYVGSSQAYTDGAGQFCIAVRRNSKVRVTAVHPAGGGTSREIDTTDVPTSIPPACSDVACLLIEDPFVVVPNRVTSTDSSGNTVSQSCADIQSPLMGSCAQPMADFFACFAPSGACTISGTGITYANGSSVSFDSLANDTVKGTYNGPNGQPCGTVAVVQATGSDSPDTTFTPTGGGDFKIDAVGSDTVITCPDGTKVTLNQAQADAYEACVGSDASSSSCTNAFTTCTADSDCSGGASCCFGQCLPAGSCPNVPGQCTTDADCPGLQCCTVQGFKVCAAQCP